MDDLSLDNVRPFDRPMTAGPNDRFVGRDDMGNKIYETVAGKRYSVRPATEDEGQTTRAKIEGWVDEGAPLPSWEQITETMKAMPGAVYDSAQRSLSGDASLGELMGFAGASGAPGVASRVGTAFDESVVSAMGATHKVPRYPKKEPVTPTPDAQPEDWTRGLLSDEDLATPPVNADPEVEAFKVAREYVYPVRRNENLRNALHENIDLNQDYVPLTVWDTIHQLRPADIDNFLNYPTQFSLSPFLRANMRPDATPEEFATNLEKLHQVVETFAQTPEFQNLRTNFEVFRDIDEARFIELNQLADGDWLGDLGGINISGDGFTDHPTIQFRDPLEEILSEMEIPPKGITGAQLLKELQDNPTVRMAQLRSQGVLDRIDPAKRYNDPKVRSNRNEVEDLLLEGKYTVQAVPQNKYDSYQRQPVADKELNYVEYAINADKDGPTFKANSQHYQDNTLAHVRLSERQNPAGNYVLIEELQSDLLQKGFFKPQKNSFENVVDYTIGELRTANPDLPPIDNQLLNVTKNDLDSVRNFIDSTDPDASLQMRKTVELLALDPRFNGVEVFDLEDFLYRLEYYESNLQGLEEVTLPPITKMEESVRLGLETAIAHAAQNNIERVVLPPFHRIVEQRFTKGTAEYNKAMDPKSGFYQTYVGAVNKVTKKLQEEMGVDVEIREFDLNYGTTADAKVLEIADSMAPYEFGNVRAALEIISGDQNALDNIAPSMGRSLRKFTDRMREIDPNFHPVQLSARMAGDGQSQSFYDALAKMYPSVSADDPGIEINFSNAIKNNYDLTRPRFAEGGVVENNIPVPPGATPKEVADDVPIMASEGEYVIPANVVRFLGLDKIEKMVEQAKMKLAELDQKGRIGGDTGEQDDLPFSPEELQRTPAADAESVGAVPRMATGGMVSDPNMQIDPATGLPLWLLRMQQGSQAPTPTPTVTAPPVAPPTSPVEPLMRQESGTDRGPGSSLTGTAQSVAKWSPAEFNKYARTRGNTGQALGSAAVSMMVPFGGLATRMRGNYLERAVPRGFDTMLETGRDLQGNPLTADQITELRSSYDRVKSTPKPRTGLIGAVRTAAENSGLVRRRESTAEQQPRRLRDVFSDRSSSSPRASGEGLISRPDKREERGGHKSSTNSNSGRTSSKKK